MLIDLHAHTSGISKCCRFPAAKILESAQKMGIDGIVLTNHYQKNYITDGDVQGFVRKYMEEICVTRRLGEQMGIHVFWGIEITMELYPNVHMLVYGVGEDFLNKHPLAFDYTLQELYAAVKEQNGALIQAHPFRNGATVLNTDFLDGVEVNCHPLYHCSHAQELFDIAQAKGLAVTCGGDFHADAYRPNCGMYFSRNILNSREIGEYLRNSDSFELCIHEPDSKDPKKVIYFRNGK